MAEQNIDDFADLLSKSLSEHNLNYEQERDAAEIRIWRGIRQRPKFSWLGTWTRVAILSSVLIIVVTTVLLVIPRSQTLNQNAEIDSLIAQLDNEIINLTELNSELGENLPIDWE